MIRVAELIDALQQLNMPYAIVTIEDLFPDEVDDPKYLEFPIRISRAYDMPSIILQGKDS